METPKIKYIGPKKHETTSFWLALFGLVIILVIVQGWLLWVEVRPKDVIIEVRELRTIIENQIIKNWNEKDQDKWEDAFFNANPELNRPE